MNQRQITNAQNGFDAYLELVEMTEPPLIFHRWAFISVVSAAIGRNIWIPFGEQNIYPNHFVTLIGPPGARKSTAINIASGMLKDSGYEHFVGDSSSKEKFMLDWEHGFDLINRGIEPNSTGGSVDLDSDIVAGMLSSGAKQIKQAYICAGELQDFFGNSNFISTLTHLWDNPAKYTDRFKNSKSVFIVNPTVNLLGGATSTSFASIFSQNIIGQGMLSRLVLVYGKGQRIKLTIPPPLNGSLKLEIIALLAEIRQGLKGALTITPEAYAAIDKIYNTFTDLPDSRLLTYSARRLTHLLKLCIVCAAANLSLVVDVETVILANTILTYTEMYMPKALGEFGKSKSSEVTQVVFEAIQTGDLQGGLTFKDLMEAVGQDVNNIHELGAILKKLAESGRIHHTDNEQGIPVFKPKKKVLVSADHEFVDFGLLWEYKLKEAE